MLFDAKIDELFILIVPVDKAILRNDIISPLSMTVGRVIDVEEDPFDIK